MRARAMQQMKTFNCIKHPHRKGGQGVPHGRVREVGGPVDLNVILEEVAPQRAPKEQGEDASHLVEALDDGARVELGRDLERVRPRGVAEGQVGEGPREEPVELEAPLGRVGDDHGGARGAEAHHDEGEVCLLDRRGGEDAARVAVG